MVTCKGNIREKPKDLEEALVVFDGSFDHPFETCFFGFNGM